jgi:LapD/MoxY periplasmic domain/Diguanylate cyclase, GGDEF domain
MSLMRQIVLLLASVLLLALAGAVGISLASTRDALQTQLRLKNSDNAQNIALALSQQRGDAQLMNLLLATQADTGFYSRMRFVGSDGALSFDREVSARPQDAPGWFAHLLPIESTPGVAQVSDGWRALGSVEVVSHVAYAHDELWRGGSRALVLLAALGAAAMLLAAAGVRRIRRPLDDTVAQANALVEGRYLLVDEPDVPELRRVAQAMNGMVERVRRLFESQAAQVEQWRREAHEDRLTGLPHRAHFMQRFAALLADDAHAEGGSLLLIRVADLADVNRDLGRETTDRALRTLADVLRKWPRSPCRARRRRRTRRQPTSLLRCARPWPVPASVLSFTSGLRSGRTVCRPAPGPCSPVPTRRSPAPRARRRFRRRSTSKPDKRSLPASRAGTAICSTHWPSAARALRSMSCSTAAVRSRTSSARCVCSSARTARSSRRRVGCRWLRAAACCPRSTCSPCDWR